MRKIIIIGASIAGHTLALSLKKECPDCELTLVTEEEHALYDKRRLFDVVLGKAKEKDILLYDAEEYQKEKITFLKECKVSSVNTERKTVYFRGRECLAFDLLVICSGRKFTLPEIPGIKKQGVFCPYTLKEYKELKSYMLGDSVCVAGSNEWAYALAQGLAVKNKEVFLINTNGSAVFPPEQARAIPAISEIKSSVLEVIGESEVQAVKLQEGKIIGASCLIYMDALKGNFDFLKQSAVKTRDGLICVDECMRTSVEGVFACGSVCARLEDTGTPLNTWEETENQARLLTGYILGSLKPA